MTTTNVSPQRPRVALIASVGRDGAIGRGNELIWRESADQKYFRRVTMGSPVLMGRRTWESLPERFRPLPGRRNIVLTRDPGWHAAGADAYPSLEAALATLDGAATPRAFVIGGAALFAEALRLADELLLTEIDADFPDADTHFPPWDRASFIEAARERHVSDAGLAHSFVTYQRDHSHV